MHMFPGETRLVICDGSNFNTVMLARGDGLYVQVTTAVTVSSTTEVTPTDVVSLGAITYDAVPIWIEAFGPDVAASGSEAILFFWWDASTELCRALEARTTASGDEKGWKASMRLTPSAGSHTYKIAAQKGTGTCSLSAGSGSGGAGTYAPIYIRAWKA